MADPFDPTRWPCWRFHVTLEPVMVHTPEEEAELPEGYRDRPYSDEEKRDHAQAVREAVVQAHKSEVEELEERLSKPIAAPKVKTARKEPMFPIKRPHRRTRR